MTVSSVLRHVDYLGTGAISTYAIPFKFFDPTTIFCTIDGADLTQGVDYSVTGDGEANAGSVVLASPLAADAQLTITRTVPFTQEVDITGQGKFLPETYEDALDVLELQIQQLAELAADYGVIVAYNAALIYDLAFYSWGPPGAGFTVAQWVLARTVSFPTNLDGSKFAPEFAPTDGPATCKLWKNGVQVGTIVFQTNGSFSVTSSAMHCVPGDVISITAPTTVDTDFAGPSGTLRGQRSPE